MKPQFHIGCSGFYNRHWKGIFYPEKLRQKDWFSFYASQLGTLEINTTFYKFPTAERLQQWHDLSPDDYLFTVKAPRVITHFNKLTNCERLLDDLYAACSEGLRDKLACILFQFPPLYSYTEERLLTLTQSLRSPYRNIVEFRHPSWLDVGILDILGSYEIIACMQDHPRMPAYYHFNHSTVYIRLHGNPELFYSGYKTAFLRRLIQRIESDGSVEEAFIYFNNTAGVEGILNAVDLKKKVKGKK